MPVVSAICTAPSSITVTVAIPECGCHTSSIGMRSSPSNVARNLENTNGFRSSPRSDGLVERLDRTPAILV